MPSGIADTVLPGRPKFGVLFVSTRLSNTRVRLPSRIGRPGRLKTSDAAGVVARGVVGDVGVGRVLDLDAGDVVLDAVAAHDDVARLSDVDAGVGGADDDASPR